MPIDSFSVMLSSKLSWQFKLIYFGQCKSGVNPMNGLQIFEQKLFLCHLLLIQNPWCSNQNCVHAVACALYVYNTISMVATWHMSYKIYTCREAYGETSLVAKNRWKSFLILNFAPKTAATSSQGHLVWHLTPLLLRWAAKKIWWRQYLRFWRHYLGFPKKNHFQVSN